MVLAHALQVNFVQENVIFLLLPTWAEDIVLSWSVWHISKTKSSVTLKLCKGMANEAF